MHTRKIIGNKNLYTDQKWKQSSNDGAYEDFMTHMGFHNGPRKHHTKTSILNDFHGQWQYKCFTILSLFHHIFNEYTQIIDYND